MDSKPWHWQGHDSARDNCSAVKIRLAAWRLFPQPGKILISQQNSMNQKLVYHVGGLHPWKLTWHWKIPHVRQEIHLQMVDVPLSMLVFGRALPQSIIILGSIVGNSLISDQIQSQPPKTESGVSQNSKHGVQAPQIKRFPSQTQVFRRHKSCGQKTINQHDQQKTHPYLDLPKGAEWMIRGAYTPSFRIKQHPVEDAGIWAHLHTI